jgi:hypothetical protein
MPTQPLARNPTSTQPLLASLAVALRQTAPMKESCPQGPDLIWWITSSPVLCRWRFGPPAFRPGVRAWNAGAEWDVRLHVMRDLGDQIG